MQWLNSNAAAGAVALRKESVDRNPKALEIIKCKEGSLSARRAWIEILPAAEVEQ